MPSHCYGSSDIPNAPKDQAIDFTVFWNRFVVGDVMWTEAQQDEEKEVDNILCQISRTDASHMQAGTYVDAAGATNQSTVSGYSFDNIAIFNGLAMGNKDAVLTEVDTMDNCLTHSSPSPGLQLHYHSLGLCMKPSAYTSTTVVPTLCKDEEDPNDSNKKTCLDDPFEWALKSWTDDTNYGGDLGLARDGHVIVGPYNKDGELWACDEHDICNGTFIDGTYVYVATETFPYIVGCWGPAHEQTVAATCSSNTCGAVAQLLIFSAALAALATIF